jgi:uncharacterized protein (DUF1800 family)
MSASLTPEQKIVHFLNRTSFGPSFESVQRVQRLGARAYLDEQLEPEKISDPVAEEKTAGLKTMRLSTRELFELYPPTKMAQDRASMAAEMQQRRLSLQELQQARFLRAVHSERQLYELMVDFWSNHFNIFAGKGPDLWLSTPYDREVIRPHALGKFRELLLATAQSPAMLFYLDNWLSSSPNAAPMRAQTITARRGINENYARELMELHTLGVDGGYTQEDVREVARCFTGWTILRPRNEAEFYFAPRMHDPGAKSVLGTRIAAGGGMEDGIKVLDLLAHHPSTARFIATKLARRFVADEPPAALVNQATEAFRRNDGDIRAVLRTIINAPEFYAPEFYRAKVKKPLEFAASALRATHAETKVTHQLARYLGRMGEPLFLSRPPTGYADVGAAWASPDMLLTRMNFAVDLVGNRLDGAKVPPNALRDVPALVRLVAPDSLSTETREALAQASEKEAPALLFAAPEFQRR